MSRRRRAKTRAWFARHTHDPFVRRARAEGRRSRAGFKLAEILDRFPIAPRPGDVALDLGAAPGAWSEELARRVGRAGVVVAVDRLPMQPLPGVRFLQGDIEDPATDAAIARALDGRRPTIVVSDIAPDLSGVRAADQPRAMRLAEAALAVAERYLAEGGAFVVKTFRGEGWDAFRDAMRARFARVRTVKPAASRQASAEIYLVGEGFRAQGALRAPNGRPE